MKTMSAKNKRPELYAPGHHTVQQSPNPVGILFLVIVLVRLAMSSDFADFNAWTIRLSLLVIHGVDALAGLAFLWFVGVVRPPGHVEDNFWACFRQQAIVSGIDICSFAIVAGVLSAWHRMRSRS
jgi:hypothetical protein